MTLTAPSGAQSDVALTETKPGLFTAADAEAASSGLHTLRSGDLVAFVSIGPANPRELTDVFSNTEPLRPIAEATGGSVRRVADRTAIGASRCRASWRCVPARASPAATGSASGRATAPSCAASRSSRWRSASSASCCWSARRVIAWMAEGRQASLAIRVGSADTRPRALASAPS